MLIGETFHQEGKLSTYRLYTYKGHVCRGSAEGYPIHLQREPSRDCEESAKKNNQKCVVNFRTVYFLCFVNIICTIIGKNLAFGQFSNGTTAVLDSSNAHHFETDFSYDVHKFNFSSQKKFLISPCLVIVLLWNANLFLATVFEFVYLSIALVFSNKNNLLRQ